MKRKHSPVKCVISATEIYRMEIHLYCGFSFFAVFFINEGDVSVTILHEAFYTFSRRVKHGGDVSQQKVKC